jgi:hypothetical protein
MIVTIWLFNRYSHGKSPFLIGKPSINGPFSMAMLNNQRVIVHIYVNIINIAMESARSGVLKASKGEGRTPPSPPHLGSKRIPRLSGGPSQLFLLLDQPH